MEEFKTEKVSTIALLRGQMRANNANLNSSQVLFKSLLKTRSVSQKIHKKLSFLNDSSSILKSRIIESPQIVNSLLKILTTHFAEPPEKNIPQSIRRRIKQVIPRQKTAAQPFEFTLQGVEYQKLERPSSKQMNKRPTSCMKSRPDPNAKNLSQISLDFKSQNEIPEHLLAEFHK